MSGECYSANELQMEFVSPKEKMPDLVHSSHRNEKEKNKLLEYETVVSSAENKCSQLKSQIERIKELYNNHNELEKNNKFGEARMPKDKTSTNSNVVIKKVNQWVQPIVKVRQNSQAISTDKTGAALGTINNIFAGITKPIDRALFSPKTYTKKEEKKNLIQPNESNSLLHGVEEVKINSRAKRTLCKKSKSKFSIKKSKSKITEIVSSTSCKKIKKCNIKIPITRNVTKIKGTTTLANPATKLIVKELNASKDVPRYKLPIENKLMRKSHDLVEIYHNNAAKESRSSESDMAKKKCPLVERAKTALDIIPPLNINDNEMSLQVPKSFDVNIYRNYTKPTISWRMKKAAKCYIGSFNIKCIPFCLSTSTSPSHNIGINIQQVMSMVKNKQPVVKISPTLAYNIGLVTGKRDETALQCLAASLTQRSLYSQCPASRSNFNYHYLQEAAKSIPQETIEELDEIEEDNSPDTQSFIITGPSGDVKVKNVKQPIWTAENNEEKCTCIIPKGNTFQQIINKFNDAGDKKGLNNISIQPIKCKEKVSEKGILEQKMKKSSSSFLPLQNKEKKLKEVLGKLHDEFEKMTKTYDELAKRTTDGAPNPAVEKELELLDNELNSKEEEIVMVMSLYKEVLALKQQVRSLKERTSKENISIKYRSKSKDDGSVTTERLLNRLLKGVQYLQTHYKK